MALTKFLAGLHGIRGGIGADDNFDALHHRDRIHKMNADDFIFSFDAKWK